MGVYQTSVHLDWSGSGSPPGVNVWYGRTTGDSGPGGNPEFDLGAQTSVLQTFYDGLRAIYPSTVTISSDGSWIREDGADRTIVSTNNTWTLNGSATSGYAPMGSCMIASLRTTSATRSGRGRKFLGPITQGVEEANGTPDENARGLVVTAIGKVVTFNQGANNGALVVWSRKAQLGRDIVGGSCPNEFGYLRSRRD